MMHEICLDRIVAALRKMGELRDVIRDTHGNLSFYEPASGVVYIKPSGVPYEKIIQDSIVGLAIVDGHICFGDLKPSVDAPHHLEIYRRYPYIRSICHTHSPNVVAFAIADEDIQVNCTEHADYFGHEIRTTGYPDIERWGTDLYLEEQERAVILSKHGALTFGTDPIDAPGEAVRLAATLEDIAHKNILARSVLNGARPWPMERENVVTWNRRYRESYGQK